MSSDLKSSTTSTVDRSSKPIALLVSLETAPDQPGTAVELEFAKLKKILSTTANRFNIRTIPQASPHELEQTLESLRDQIELIYFVAHSERIDDLVSQVEYVSSLFQILQDASPRFVFANGFDGPAANQFMKLAEQNPFDCYMTLERTPPQISSTLVESFFRKLAAGSTAKQAFQEVDRTVKDREQTANLPWNINGRRTNYRMVRKPKGVARRSLLSRIFGRPKFPEPAIALLIQAAAENDLYHSKLEIDEIEDALNGTEHCEPVPLKNATIESVLACLEKYGERIEIIHFAGHANGQSIQLRSEKQRDGEIQLVYMSGLAEDFAKVKPKLIFINGCSSEQQATELMRRPDRAWSIMTDSEIDDNRACELAKSFYQRIAHGENVESAYEASRKQIEDSLTRENESPAQAAYRAIDLGDETPITRNRFPWRIFPNSQEWQLGMTQLEQIENAGGPGWRLTDVEWGTQKFSRWIGLAVFMLCLFVGICAWTLAFIPSDAWLPKNWVPADGKSPIIVDLDDPKFDSLTAETDDKQSFQSLGSDLWLVNRVAENENRDVVLKLRRQSAKPVFEAIAVEQLRFIDAPSVSWWRMLLLLFGLGLVYTLVRILRDFGCWHVRQFKTGLKPHEDIGLRRQLKVFFQTLFRSINEHRQGTVLVVLCMIGLGPLLVLPVYDWFNRENFVPQRVHSIEFDGDKTETDSANWQLGSLANTFPSLKKLVFRDTKFADPLISQLMDMENHYGPGHLDFDVGLDRPVRNRLDGVLAPDQNVFLEPASYLIEKEFGDESNVFEFLSQEKKVHYFQRLSDLHRARPNASTDDSLENYIGMPESLPAYGPLKITVKKWPLPEELITPFYSFLEQASREQLHVDIAANPAQNGNSVQDILKSIGRANNLNIRLNQLELSGNSLSPDDIQSIKQFENLEALYVNECEIDKNELQSLLLGMKTLPTDGELVFSSDNQSISISGELTRQQHMQLMELVKTACGTADILDRCVLIDRSADDRWMTTMEQRLRDLIGYCQLNMLVWDAAISQDHLVVTGVAKSWDCNQVMTNEARQKLGLTTRIVLPDDMPLKKLTQLDCYHNQFTADELEKIVKWRIGKYQNKMSESEKLAVKSMERNDLTTLGSDAWAQTRGDNVDEVFKNFKRQQVYKILDEITRDEGAYGKVTLTFDQGDSIKIHPKKVKLDKDEGIQFLSFLKYVPQLHFDFTKNYKAQNVGMLAKLEMEVDELTLDNIKNSKEFLKTLFESPLIRKPKRLKLAKISAECTDKNLFLPIERLADSNVRSFEFHGPICILGMAGLKSNLDSLTIICPTNGEFNRRQRRFCDLIDGPKSTDSIIVNFINQWAFQFKQMMRNSGPRPQVKQIKIVNAVVHQTELQEFLSLSPNILDLSESEWENSQTTNLAEFAELFETLRTDASAADISSPEVLLPCKFCTQFPKLKMPIFTHSEFVKIPYFKKLHDTAPGQYLLATRTYLPIKGGSLFLLGNKSDITNSLDLLAKVNKNSKQFPVANLYIKTTEKKSGLLAETFQVITKQLADIDQLFDNIAVKGEFVGDELPTHLALYSKCYDFRGCPKVTPRGVHRLAVFCQGQDLRDRTVHLSGAMGIGQISEELKNDQTIAKFPKFQLNYSNSLITVDEQKRLSEIKVFSNTSKWTTINYVPFDSWSTTPEDQQKLWELVVTIESFLESGDPLKRQRALILAGAELDEQGNPQKSKPTKLERDLKESQVNSGYWPLILVVKAAVAAERNDYAAAVGFVENAHERSFSIRKNYWNDQQKIKSHRQQYRKQFADLLKKYKAKQNHLQANHIFQP